jgi:hypothetical protein
VAFERMLVFCAITFAVVALAPVILVVGEPVRRYYVRRLARPAAWRGLARLVIANPVLIALTAPGRWTLDQVGAGNSGGSGPSRSERPGRKRGPGDGPLPPETGVREPRSPRPGTPAGAIALAEPRHQHQVIRIRKAMPPALSEPVERTGSRPGQLVKVLLRRIGRPLAQLRRLRA